MEHFRSERLQEFRAELHVHTVLSPCAAVEMIPPLIIREAIKHRLKIIAITDHNASANVPAVIKAAAGTGLTIIPGMELQTAEEVHLLCLFAGWDKLQNFQRKVDALLPRQENNPAFFGEQFVVDETGDYLYRENRLLLNSCRINFESAVLLTRELGGLAIPAHVDRRAFGLFANLGFLPPQTQVDAVEISRHTTAQAVIKAHPELTATPMLQGGDVHHLADFLGANLFILGEPSFEEIRMALQGINGRSIRIDRLAVDNLQQDV